MNRRARLLLCGLLLLVSCDDMTSQPKWLDYSPAAGPVAPPPATVAFQDQPAQAPPLDAALMQRGQHEFRIYCTPCHAESGDGNGMIVQRGFPHPPSLLSAQLRQASTQLFYDTITNGHGAMYSYAARVAPRDRWAIAAYVRALQLADNAPVAAVPAAERGALR